MTTATATNYEIREVGSQIAEEDWFSLHHVANFAGGGQLDDWVRGCEAKGIETRTLSGKWPMIRRRDVEKLLGPQKARAFLLGKRDQIPQWVHSSPLAGTLGVSHLLAPFLAKLRGAATRDGSPGVETLAADAVVLRRNLERERSLKVSEEDWVPADDIKAHVERATARSLLISPDQLDYELDANGLPRHANYHTLAFRLNLLGCRYRNITGKLWSPKQLSVNAFDLYRLFGVVDPAREDDFQARIAFAAGEEPLA